MTQGDIAGQGAPQRKAIQQIEMQPTASFGRKDGLAYFLPTALLPLDQKFSLDASFQTLQTATDKKFIFPSHSLEVLSLVDWANFLAYKSKIYLQVTAGPELAHYKMNLLDVLDLGFSVQIWFDNPKDYRELCECWQSLYPGQIFLCFLPNKSFDHQHLLDFQLKSDLQILFLPKQSSLDSRLNFEEILWFKQALVEKQNQVEFLVDPQILEKLRIEEREFFQQLSYESLQNMLLRKNKILFVFLVLFRGFQNLRLSFFLDVLKQVLLFIAKPTLKSSQAILHLFGFKFIEVAGSAKVAGVKSYWGLRHLGASIKAQYWELHRGPYQYLWKIKRSFQVAILKAPGVIKSYYWALYREAFRLVVAVYFVIRNLPARMRTFSWRIFLHPHRLFWALYSWTYRLLIRAFWVLYSWSHRIVIRTYWGLYRFVDRIGYRSVAVFNFVRHHLLMTRFMLTKAIVLGSSRVYVTMVRVFFALITGLGIMRVLMIRLLFAVGSLFSWLRIYLMRFFIRLYWTLAKVRYLPQLTLGFLIQMKWTIHRGPYQIFLKVLLAVQTVLRLVFWAGYKVAIASAFKIRGLPFLMFGMFASLYGGCVRFFWWWHRGPFQLLLRTRFILQSVVLRVYWTSYRLIHSFTGVLVFVLGYGRFAWSFAYWKVIHRLWYVVRFPFYKVYWFLSFQFKKRILKQISSSESPV